MIFLVSNCLFSMLFCCFSIVFHVITGFLSSSGSVSVVENTNLIVQCLFSVYNLTIRRKCILVREPKFPNLPGRLSPEPH